MKNQVGNDKTKKHINKINGLLSVGSKAATQTWDTSVRWPDLSVLENEFNWDNDEEGWQGKEKNEDDEAECDDFDSEDL